MSGACLHPPLSSSSSALPIFFFFLLHAAAVLFQFSSPTDAGGVICPPHDCGDGVKIRYPLWYNGSTAQSYASGNGTYICGHPDLAVHCNMKKQPVLRMGGDYYQVAAVDYKKGTISLKDMDLLGSSCPRARHNLTLNGLPLVAQDVSYILFFFNCTEDPSLFFSQPFHPLTCLDRYSYALVEDSFPAQWNSWLNVCEELVRSPVKKPDETHLNLTDFTRILQDGFPLELSSEEADKCRNCELKNQACGYVRSGNTANFALTCLCDTEDGRCPESARARHMRIIITAFGVFCGTAIFTCICIWWRKASTKTHYTGRTLYTATRIFEPLTLRAATNNFSDSNQIGEGGFGVVYMGVLEDGHRIAVKRLSSTSNQGIEELRNEVELLARQEHRNLIRLLGVCLGEENLLVYEYMPNGSLDSFLFGPAESRRLPWELRYKIIQGIARGMQYLHEESRYTIVHRDLKASNILLDAHMNPKISDFGISKLFGDDQTHASASRIVGTFGYMAPEYVFDGRFSHKSDVFSFGILILEIVTGRKSNSFSYSDIYSNLPGYVWEHWTSDEVNEIIDPALGAGYQMTEVLRCVQIGLLCIQERPVNRPTMSSVVLMFDDLSMSLNVPSQPAFLPFAFEVDQPHKEMPSLMELTITDIDPR